MAFPSSFPSSLLPSYLQRCPRAPGGCCRSRHQGLKSWLVWVKISSAGSSCCSVGECCRVLAHSHPCFSSTGPATRSLRTSLLSWSFRSSTLAWWMIMASSPSSRASGPRWDGSGRSGCKELAKAREMSLTCRSTTMMPVCEPMCPPQPSLRDPSLQDSESDSALKVTPEGCDGKLGHGHKEEMLSPQPAAGKGLSTLHCSQAGHPAGTSPIE
ncbi:uncharacterized protein C11orf94 homolog isoform X1 [Strigops habroptila]|uniref:uncharacterized protein C11orf94 homolog isoform X1 n=1 Tax=Strigops habroptila TaxID=2489341 RepID=UPI0011CEE1DF|nr:uncharacterized protein C11orf94 homolog isoform X1 [Strigops habroptila]